MKDFTAPEVDYDRDRLLHELQVQRALLKAQGEELRETRTELAEVRARYSDLLLRPPAPPTGSPSGESRQSLHQSEQRYRLLFESLQEVVFLHELVTEGEGGGADLRLLDANRAALELLGLPREQVLGRGLKELFPEMEPGLAAAALRSALTGEPASLGERCVSGRWLHSYAYAPQPRQVALVSLDITERKRMEIALQKSESSLAEAQHMAGIGGWEWDLRTGELRWSPELYAIYGVDPNGFTPSIDSLTDHLHPDDAEAVQQMIRQTRADGSALNFDFRIKRGDGSTRILHCVGEVAAYDEDGKPRLMVGVSQDITERKRVEEALVATRRLYKLLADTTPDLVTMYDHTGRPTYVNKRWMRYTGLTLQGLQQQGCGSLYHPDDLPRLTRAGDAAAWPSTPYQEEFRYRRHDGSYRWFWSRMVPVQEDGGKIGNWIAIATDITEQKESREALRLSEERFRKIFEQGPLGAVIVDLDYRFVKVNRRFCDMVGYSAQELSRLTFVELTHPDDLELTLSQPALLREGAFSHFSLEKRYRHKNGEPVWVTVTAWLMRDRDGAPLQFIATVEDISEKKRLQERVILSAKRDERAKSLKTIQDYQKRLSQLASKLSLAQEEERRRIAVQVHDSIGQNLAFCKLKVGQLQQLHAGAAPGLGEVIDTLDRCITASRSLSFELSPAVLFDLGLEPALEWLARLHAARHGVSISVTGQSGRELPLPSRILLFQAAREFVANVVKHSRAARAELSLSASKKSVMLTVRDDGTGFSIPGTGTVPDSNGGFGLFSVQEQLRNAGGFLEITSTPGAGTTARATLPLAAPPRRRKPC